MKKKVTKHHKDGSVSAVGQELDGLPDGYWEWFRIDGTKKTEWILQQRYTCW